MVRVRPGGVKCVPLLSFQSLASWDAHYDWARALSSWIFRLKFQPQISVIGKVQLGRGELPELFPSGGLVNRVSPDGNQVHTTLVQPRRGPRANVNDSICVGHREDAPAMGGHMVRHQRQGAPQVRLEVEDCRVVGIRITGLVSAGPTRVGPLRSRCPVVLMSRPKA